MNGERDLRIVRRTTAAQGVVLLDLERPDGDGLPMWTPGAHVDVLLPDGLGERQYSLCGDPAERVRWRIGVLREAAGRGGSAWLHDRSEGDVLRVRGPRNHFAFQPRPGREYLFVAGGIGITPISAMVQAADRAGVAWRLVYAGRSRGTMALLDELVGRHGDRVQVFAGDEGRRADVQALLDAAPDAVVYCCGPSRLIEAVQQAGAGRGSGHLHLERFEARQLEAPVWTEPFEVELLLSGTTVTVPPDRSILEVVEEQGVLALASCRVGTCGTCETPIVDGVIDHRDSVLSPEEQDDDFAMMICVSRAACPRIVLEL
ncbi:PDR/VanB family oxidoreductase [uncultured Amnibacterium sp.]|uniref:PDR/VanB family oxidoreductase n=1 Tax=uncultured Amnibacterium sp. TaxID=1631851 RepID=UPI0035CBA55B